MFTPPRNQSLDAVEANALFILGILQTDYTVNYVAMHTPIAIGIGAFSQGDAATILQMINEDELIPLPVDIQSELSNHIFWWNTRFLTKDEANFFVLWMQSTPAIVVQQDFWKWKSLFLTELLESYGFDRQAYPREYTLALCLLQIDSKAACSVFQESGGFADLENLYTTALNNPVFYALWQNLSDAVDLLQEWDGTSFPTTSYMFQEEFDEGGD